MEKKQRARNQSILPQKNYRPSTADLFDEIADMQTLTLKKQIPTR